MTRTCLVALSLVTGWLPAQQDRSPQRPAILGAAGGPGFSFDCAAMDASVLAASAAVITVCPLALMGGAAFATDSIVGDGLLVAFDKEGAMVAVHNPSADATSSFVGTIDHTGQQDEIIRWGLWRSGSMEALPSRQHFIVDDHNAVPYIAGVSTHSIAIHDRGLGRLRRLSDLPADGLASYTLAGDAGVVSQKDTQGNIVPVGKVEAAHATIDFKNRTGHLDLSIEVRGTSATLLLPLVPQNGVLGFDTGARSTGGPCRRPAPDEFCPAATLQFYGRDGQFLGITFSYGHSTVLSEAASVAAHLNNVLAQGAIVLRRD